MVDRKHVRRLGSVSSDLTLDMLEISVGTYDGCVSLITFLILPVNHTHWLGKSVRKRRAEQDNGDSIGSDSSFSAPPSLITRQVNYKISTSLLFYSILRGTQ